MLFRSGVSRRAMALAAKRAAQSPALRGRVVLVASHAEGDTDLELHLEHLLASAAGDAAVEARLRAAGPRELLLLAEDGLVPEPRAARAIKSVVQLFRDRLVRPFAPSHA